MAVSVAFWIGEPSLWCHVLQGEQREPFAQFQPAKVVRIPYRYPRSCEDHGRQTPTRGLGSLGNGPSLRKGEPLGHLVNDFDERVGVFARGAKERTKNSLN
eukprot:6473289-Amphidinium_carterae.2